jgi:ethanolamine ammonia-lyase small subunit
MTHPSDPGVPLRKEAAEAAPAAISGLRRLTPARVALGRTGVSLATREGLDFSLCHALARDAVHAVLDPQALVAGLEQRGLRATAVRSAARDRAVYLRRPDLGRKLSQESATALAGAEAAPPHREARACRIAVVIADGLSALAVDRHALPLLDALLPLLTELGSLQVVIAEQARVAIGDEIGSLLEADLSLMLIGERPGLSSPDSLGAYITWSPRPGRTDAERNCVSNIRLEGLSYDAAARKITYLCREAARLQLTGTALKEAAATDRLPGLAAEPGGDGPAAGLPA